MRMVNCLMDETLIKRFDAKSPDSDSLSHDGTPCRIWTGYINRDGYGMFADGKRLMRAHRFSYEQYIGPIPEDFHVDHLCRRRACVAPLHLEAVPCATNIQRGESGKARGEQMLAKTHCPKGHPYEGDNLYLRASSPASRSGRSCRECARQRGRKLNPKGPWELTKTHCPKGHPYEGDNLYVTPTGHRQCKICRRHRENERYHAGKRSQGQAGKPSPDLIVNVNS